jgi:hypothetical protein
MLPTNTYSLDYVRFEVGDSFHMCHKDTIMKYPRSLLASLLHESKDTRESGLDYIKINRDGKHFATILNLMRHEDVLYVQGYGPDHLKELNSELDYYKLHELEDFLRRSWLTRSSDSRICLKLVMDNHSSFLEDIERPLVVMGLSVIQRLISLDYLGTNISELFDTFDHSKYDVCLFANHPICSEDDTLQVFLYKPGFSKPKMEYIREDCFSGKSTDTFKRFLCQALTAVNVCLLDTANIRVRLSLCPYVVSFLDEEGESEGEEIKVEDKEREVEDEEREVEEGGVEDEEEPLHI